jgi:hypothetical protein
MKKSEIREMIREELLKEKETGILYLGSNWDIDEKASIAGAINYFGSGDHPLATATDKSMKYFAKDYAKDCITKGLSKMSTKGKQLAKSILKKIENM